MNYRLLLPLLLSPYLAVAASAEALTIRIAGSTTVARTLMPYRPGVESAHNVKLLLLPVGSGRGLVELAAGRVDAAMVSGPLPGLLENLRRSGASLPALESLELLKLPANPRGQLVALLHPSNPLRQLDRQQIAQILTGQITNWKQFGGEDRPITVVLPDQLDGIRCSVNESFLLNSPLVADALILPSVTDLPAAILREPGAIGIAPRGMPAGDSALAEITPTLDVPLYLVARRAALEANPKLEIVLNTLHSRAR